MRSRPVFTRLFQHILICEASSCALIARSPEVRVHQGPDSARDRIGIRLTPPASGGLLAYNHSDGPIMRMTLLLAAVRVVSTGQVAAQDNNAIGFLPTGADGKPLNLDFETGTLAGWTAEGGAFKDQPIKGDTVFPRRADNKS